LSYYFCCLRVCHLTGRAVGLFEPSQSEENTKIYDLALDEYGECVKSLSNKYHMMLTFATSAINTSRLVPDNYYENEYLTGTFANLTKSHSRDAFLFEPTLQKSMRTRTVIVSLSYRDIEQYVSTSKRVGGRIDVDFFIGVSIFSIKTGRLAYLQSKQNVLTTIGDTFVLSHNVYSDTLPMPAISIHLTRIHDTTPSSDHGKTWDFVTFLFDLPLGQSNLDKTLYDMNDAIPADSVAGSIAYFETDGSSSQKIRYPCILQPDMESYQQFLENNQCATIQSVSFPPRFYVCTPTHPLSHTYAPSMAQELLLCKIRRLVCTLRISTNLLIFCMLLKHAQDPQSIAPPHTPSHPHTQAPVGSWANMGLLHIFIALL